MALSTISGTTGITDATITSAKLADFAAAVDLNGVELILDADQDTSITADTDDRIDFKLGGVEHISLNNSSGDTVIKPMVDGKDIVFQQYDGNKILEINDGNYVAISGAAAGPGELRFYEDTDLGTNYTGFKAGNATASVSYVLPLADGTDGYQLTTDGSGTLSWAAAGTTLSGSTNNTVVTVTGANALAGEGNLTFDGSTLAVTGAATVSSTLSATTITASTAFVPDASDGAALGTTSLEFSDLFLADGAVISLGDDDDVTLTHVADTGILLNSTMAIQFNDASQYINAPSNAILDINATDEIELNATLVDVNANLDVSGTITSGGVVTGTAFTAGSAVLAEAELELLDGLTAGTAIASKVVTTDANIDSTGMRNLTISGTFSDGNYTFDTSGNVSGLGTIGSGNITSSGTVQGTTITATTAFVPDASGGADLGTTALEFNDAFFNDGAVINFGDDQDTTLTHTDGTGLTLNSTNKLCFNDASQFIHGSSNAVLDIGATDEIELTATLIDVVGNFTNSGTIVSAGTISSTGDTTITSGDLVFATAGKGVCLGVTSNTDANTLDDYEEGSFSPTWAPSTSGSIVTNGTYTGGIYTKVGNLVTIAWRLYTNSVSSPVGQITIAGLPFTIRSGAYAAPKVIFPLQGLSANLTGDPVGTLQGNTATVLVGDHLWGIAEGGSNLADKFDSDVWSTGTFSYFT
jgi:hypothetical protein